MATPLHNTYPYRMRQHLTLLALAVATVIFTGCAVTIPEPVEATTPPEKTRTEVDWSQYPDAMQRIIDEEQAEGDCTALQDMFNIADNAGFLDQMNYIHEALKLAGCYD